MKKLNQKTKITLKSFILVTLLITMFFNIIAIVAAALDTSSINYAEPEYISNSATLVELPEPATKVALVAEPMLFLDLDYVTYYNIDDYKSLLEVVQNSIAHITNAIDSEMYTYEAIDKMYQEINRLQAVVDRILFSIQKITVQEEEYYYATKTWEFFMQRGFSEAVVSGIIGNMMVETSGGTLALNPSIYDSTGGYYGLCQWSLYYKPELANMPFESQLEYLASDMEKEFNTFGNCYKIGFTYEDFLSMTDPAEAAKAFAMVYERCGSSYYSIRMQAAQVSYDYFN